MDNKKKPVTVKELKSSINATIAEVENFQKEIDAMSKESFAYYVYNYQSRVNIPMLAMAAIYNDKFNTSLSSYKEVVELMESSDERLKEVAADTEWYTEVPIFFYRYMKYFWEKALLELQLSWEPDPLDLAIMITEYQREQQYSIYWPFNVIKMFYGTTKPNDILNSLVLEAREVLDDGDSVKKGTEFYWLLAISMGSYLNGLRLTEAVEYKLKRDYSLLYQNYRKSADNKIKKAATGKTIKAIKFNKDELVVLRFKNENNFIKKCVRTVIERL